ncbi:CLUMA_CG008455, isoform A [Clunio marinus]|uniref:CLUMA_CG008455, isoform A n=1 Tax=Clunio marinus TaxID=568069 RepID=A0A1J1I3Q0_9DIPT|nr:CLUMA_CG008455, isoform A [Clunio marinus]
MLLQRHLRRLHEYKGPSLTCEVCGKISITQAEHRRHVMVHTDELPYKCKFCSRKFKHRSGARYHTLSEHTGERPYHCPVENCDLTFIDHPNANKHIKTTHGLIGVKPVLVRKNK